MSTDRVVKFHEDASALLTTSPLHATGLDAKNRGKIESQVKKLASWLQKHQNETLPDGIKTKLFSTIDMYYRYCSGSIGDDGLLNSTEEMIGAYLQLPEGKLMTSKHKQKAMGWLNELSGLAAPAAGGVCGGDAVSGACIISDWTIEGVSDEDGSLTLLSTANEELWKENFIASNGNEYIDAIRRMCSEHESVFLRLDETNNTILDITTSLEPIKS